MEMAAQENYPKIIKINVRTQRESFEVEIHEHATVSQLKSKISEKLLLSESQFRLIFSGKMLEDEENLKVINLQDGYTVHLIVRITRDDDTSGSNSQAGPTNRRRNGSSKSGSSGVSVGGCRRSSASVGVDVDANGGTRPVQAVNPSANFIEVRERLHRMRDRIHQIESRNRPPVMGEVSTITQNLADIIRDRIRPMIENATGVRNPGVRNPEQIIVQDLQEIVQDLQEFNRNLNSLSDQMTQLINSFTEDNPTSTERNSFDDLLSTNPDIQNLVDHNPALLHVINNHQHVRRTVESIRSPATFQELRRAQDRSMSNLESLPGGFNALQRAYREVQQPFIEAVQDQLFNLNMAQHSSHTSGGSDMENQQGSININPLPNPWSTSVNSESLFSTPSVGTSVFSSFVPSSSTNSGSSFGTYQYPAGYSPFSSLYAYPGVSPSPSQSFSTTPGVSPFSFQNSGSNPGYTLFTTQNAGPNPPRSQFIFSNPGSTPLLSPFSFQNSGSNPTFSAPSSGLTPGFSSFSTPNSGPNPGSGNQNNGSGIASSHSCPKHSKKPSSKSNENRPSTLPSPIRRPSGPSNCVPQNNSRPSRPRSRGRPFFPSQPDITETENSTNPTTSLPNLSSSSTSSMINPNVIITQNPHYPGFGSATFTTLSSQSSNGNQIRPSTARNGPTTGSEPSGYHFNGYTPSGGIFPNYISTFVSSSPSTPNLFSGQFGDPNGPFSFTGNGSSGNFVSFGAAVDGSNSGQFGASRPSTAPPTSGQGFGFPRAPSYVFGSSPFGSQSGNHWENFGGQAGGDTMENQDPENPKSNPNVRGYSTLPPEIHYREELRQLENMGFNNKDRNLRAISSTYGDVSAAVEKLIRYPNY